MPNIAIVIVNYRTPDLVIDCLASLADVVASDLNISVYIGDADSGDGSSAQIQSHITDQSLDWATCFDIGENGGFAFGNNAILTRYVLPRGDVDYVYFLNPDTYILPGAVHALINQLQQVPNAGVVGSRLENPDGTWRAYGFRFPTPWREFFRGARLGALDRLVQTAAVSIPDLAETCQVDWVTGASFMMPRVVLDEVGLMDDSYFLYFEETELMARVRDAGYSIWHVAESRVVHLAGASTGVRTGDAEIKRLSPVWLRSRNRFMRARYGRVGAVGATVLFLAGDLVYRLHRVVRRQDLETPPHLWRDYITYSFGQRQDKP